MTDEYRDPIEEAERTAKDPETAPAAPDDWPRVTPDRAPEPPTEDIDPEAETKGGLEP